MKEIFLIPNLAYDVSLVAEVICLIALHPRALEITDQAFHKITGLPMDASEVPHGMKQQWKCYTHLPTHLMRAITGVVEGKKYNWVTVSSHSGSKVVYTLGDSKYSKVARMDRSIWMRIEGGMDKLEKISAITPSHGQSMDLRQVEDTKERKRKKGKYKVEEDTLQKTLEEPPQPSIELTGTSGVNQLAKKVGKEANDAHKQVVTITKDLEFMEWKDNTMTEEEDAPEFLVVISITHREQGVDELRSLYRELNDAERAMLRTCGLRCAY
eukprot:Gb_39228 [translate_table: standard]